MRAGADPSSKRGPSQGDSTRRYSPLNISRPNCVLTRNHKTSEISKDGGGLWQNIPSAPSVRTPRGTTSNPQSNGLRVHETTCVGVDDQEWDPSGNVFTKDCVLRTHKTHVAEKMDESKEFGNTRRGRALWGEQMQRYTAETNKETNQRGKPAAPVPKPQSHRNVRTGEKIYKCEDCRRAFAYHSFLMQHMKIHTGEKPYECETCGKAFRYSLHLNKHLAWHVAEKSHKCKECGKAFRKSSDLTKHTRIHTGERPYVCKVCGRDFTVRSGLKNHLKKHS